MLVESSRDGRLDAAFASVVASRNSDFARELETTRQQIRNVLCHSAEDGRLAAALQKVKLQDDVETVQRENTLEAKRQQVREVLCRSAEDGRLATALQKVTLQDDVETVRTENMLETTRHQLWDVLCRSAEDGRLARALGRLDERDTARHVVKRVLAASALEGCPPVEQRAQPGEAATSLTDRLENETEPGDRLVRARPDASESLDEGSQSLPRALLRGSVPQVDKDILMVRAKARQSFERKVGTDLDMVPQVRDLDFCDNQRLATPTPPVGTPTRRRKVIGAVRRSVETAVPSAIAGETFSRRKTKHEKQDLTERVATKASEFCTLSPSPRSASACVSRDRMHRPKCEPTVGSACAMDLSSDGTQSPTRTLGKTLKLSRGFGGEVQWSACAMSLSGARLSKSVDTSRAVKYTVDRRLAPELPWINSSPVDALACSVRLPRESLWR